VSVEILTEEELPPGVSYPAAFRRLVDRGLLYFEPWFVLEGDQLRERLQGLRLRYPDRTLVPFARREDNDDVACFDATRPGRVVVIHDFAQPGWEQRAVLDDFAAWLRRALEDMITFDVAEDDAAESSGPEGTE
jgi:hypothetical protein